METVSIKKSAVYLLFLSTFILFSAASYFRFVENYELGSLDARFLLRTPAPTISDKIAIVEIGEDTIRKLGRFPFDRSYHAIIVKALGEFGAKAVVFDLLFSEPHEHDGELAEAVKEHGSVYLPYAFSINNRKGSVLTEADGYLAAVTGDLAKAAKATGHINVVPDIDGKFRRVPPYIKYEGAFYPYLSLKAVCDYLDISAKDIKIIPAKCILLGKDIRIPLDDKSNMIVNFSGKWGALYSHYSFVDLLQSYATHIMGDRPAIKADSLKGKICIIGLTAAGTGDIHPSPFEALCPGVGIHAEVINSILNKKFIARASRLSNMAILIMLGAIMSFVTLKTKPLSGFFALTGLLIVFILAAILLFNILGLWIDIVCPAVATGAFYLLCVLYKYISEWKKRLIIENELGIAKEIQESFLPKAVPDVAGLEMAAKMLTARQVGGDLYSFIEFGEDRIGVMIGDVSGKGVPASLFMAMVAGAFKSFAVADSAPDDVLSGLNRKLAKESSTGLFVTVFYAIFDLKTKTVVYASGGHLPVMYLREKEEAGFLDTKDGSPLGLMEGRYSADRMVITKGDTFVFYTDGVTEAMNSNSEMYGKERLASLVLKNRHLAPRDILAAIGKDVRSFEPKDNQHDDITIIVVKVA